VPRRDRDDRGYHRDVDPARRAMPERCALVFGTLAATPDETAAVEEFWRAVDRAAAGSSGDARALRGAAARLRRALG